MKNILSDSCYDRIWTTPSNGLREFGKSDLSVPLVLLALISLLLIGGCRTFETSNENDGPLVVIDRAAADIATASTAAAGRSGPSPTILISPVRKSTELAQFNEFVTRRIGQSLSTLSDVTLVTRNHISEVVNEIEFQRLEHWNASGEVVPLFDQDAVFEVGLEFP